MFLSCEINETDVSSSQEESLKLKTGSKDVVLKTLSAIIGITFGVPAVLLIAGVYTANNWLSN
jgi:hypothetical protein